MTQEDIGDKIDADIAATISTKCIKGHKFQVPKDKIQTSSTGKSFVTLCPKCNGVARLKKDDVYKLFGVNPRDHVAVGKLFETLAVGKVPEQGQTTSVPPTTSTPSPISQVTVDDSVDDDDDDPDADMDVSDDDFSDDDDEEKEYTAVMEVADDVTGKSKSVNRFRVVSDDDEDPDDGDNEQDDEEYEDRPRTPVKSSKQAKPKAAKPRKKVERAYADDDDGDLDDPEEDDRSSRKSRGRDVARRQERVKPVVEEMFDPNEVLKDLLEEAGLDETTLARLFEYVDMQPDGWQPAAIQGVLQMYISPASAQKIAARYQAELYKEEKKRERERQMLNMVGLPSGNMRLSDTRDGGGFPLMNAPLQQGGGFMSPMNRSAFPPSGMAAGMVPSSRDVPQGQYDQSYPPRPIPTAPRGLSAFEVERMIDSKMNNVVKQITEAIGGTKREDAIAQEARESRMMMMELMKSIMLQKSVEPQKSSDPQVTQMMQAQNDMVNKLLTNALERKPSDDPMNNPMMKIIVNELLTSKKPNSAAPPLSTTSEELGQRIQLQRLANDLELAQADFKDKQESRAFTRELAGQALSKIGESVAAAYIETQRIQAEAQKEIASRQAGLVPTARTASESIVSKLPPVASAPMSISSDRNPQQSADVGTRHRVKGVSSSDGMIHMECPTCGSSMTAKPGDGQVSCSRCGSVYSARAPTTKHVEAPVDKQSSASENGVPEDPPKSSSESKPSSADDGDKSHYYDGDASESNHQETQKPNGTDVVRPKVIL